MNTQEIFDKVATHLLTQRQRSETNYGDEANTECSYYGDNGLRCAVGCLIEPAYYSVSLEGNSALEENVTEALEKSGVEPNPQVLSLLLELQRLHDACEPEDWQRKLCGFGAHNGFDCTVPLGFAP